MDKMEIKQNINNPSCLTLKINTFATLKVFPVQANSIHCDETQ